MKNTSRKPYVFVGALLALLLSFGLMGCGKDTASGEFQDPYEAYGLQKGDSGLDQAMHDKPPKAIVFKPVYLDAFGGEPLTMEEIALAKGDKDTINLDITKVTSEDNMRKTTGYLTAQVDITYNPSKDGSLFQIYNEAAYKQVYKHVNIPERVRGEKNIKADSIYQISKWGLPGIPNDEYLTFVLGEKGKGGNLGMILCQIVKVKL